MASNPFKLTFRGTLKQPFVHVISDGVHYLQVVKQLLLIEQLTEHENNLEEHHHFLMWM